MAKVLIGCEVWGEIREAFIRLGHDAWSCDVDPAATPTNRHIQGDLMSVVMSDVWDLLIVMCPPCTRLCNSGVRWLTGEKLPKNKTREQLWAELKAAGQFFGQCIHIRRQHSVNVRAIAVENPVMHIHAKRCIPDFRKHDESHHPWHYAVSDDDHDNEKKLTLLWTEELPRLIRTGLVDGSTARSSVLKATPGEDRGSRRSKFWPRMSEQMAVQWGDHVSKNETHQCLLPGLALSDRSTHASV